MIKEREEFALKELFFTLLSKIWIIVLCGAVVAGAVGIYTAFMKKDVYTASATIYVYKERANETASTAYYDSITSQKMVKTYSIVLESRTFLTKVIQSVDPNGEYGLTTAKLASALSVKQIDETEVFNVYFSSLDKDLTYVVMSKVTELAKTELKQIVNEQASDVKIIDEPEIPTSPDDKQLFMKSFLGFLVGAVIAIVVILLVDRFDIVIRDKEKIEDNFDIPVLGVIPRQDFSDNSKYGGGQYVRS